ncbi:MAG: hypothetical protein ACPHJ3_05740 [Rubripirellula sp.]
MSKSYPRDLASYVSSRLLTIPMLALLILLLLAAWLPAFPNDALTAVTQILITANLLAMFRLWDDLSDLAADRITNPDRVLCKTAHQALFRWTGVILTLTAISMLTATNPRSGIGFVFLVIIFAIYYKLPWRSLWPRLSYHLLILKYPCFIALICSCNNQTISNQHLMVMLVAYFILCIYEVVHDPDLRADTWCRGLAGIELLAAIITASWVTNTLL